MTKVTCSERRRELSTLTQRLSARLATTRRNRRPTRPKQVRVATVRQLLRDVLLVTSGRRPSCLVDCCALTKELAAVVLQFLHDEATASSQRRWIDPRELRAVLLDDNVFFVHVTALVREKMLELATGLDAPVLVDVSAHLTRPELVSVSSAAGRAKATALASWTVSACRALLESTSARCHVLEWQRPSNVTASAVAGRLLCYPFVYDTTPEDSTAVESDGWHAQDTCLGLCPLWLVQTAITSPSDALDIVLQEFSVPQHLLDIAVDNEDDVCVQQTKETDLRLLSPRLNVLRAHWQRQLQRRVAPSGDTTRNDVRVRLDRRTLHRVAL
ncbi:unnamed protein product [Hyaloperonospora brassicae]|uniref:Uncharacterized protein n=1 Tax=Hyaloperonospora brassicae TaxID=162125 RepID=A0AAV0UZW1_HYABA|nr:unnamed protein product [Hyaloperonospora brassicae]